MSEQLLSGYSLRAGSGLDRARLVKFIQRTYQEIFPKQDFSHLARTVEQYFSKDTPLWWVDFSTPEPRNISSTVTVACLWAGNAVDQVQGDRHTHIFLLYVIPEHRRRGIAKVLMQQVETWAASRGDHQISLQVFQSNQPALNLYQQLGYKIQSVSMIKSLHQQTEVE